MLKIIFSTIAINNGFGVTDPKGECVNWRFLYTKIPQITLSHFLLLGLFTSYLLSIEMLQNIIFINCNVKEYNLQHYTIAFLRPRGLSSFQLHSIQQITNENLLTELFENGYSIRPIEMSKHLTLNISYSSVPEIPPPTLFYCSRITRLTMPNYILIHIPTNQFRPIQASHYLLLPKDTELTQDSLAVFTSH